MHALDKACEREVIHTEVVTCETLVTLITCGTTSDEQRRVSTREMAESQKDKLGKDYFLLTRVLQGQGWQIGRDWLESGSECVRVSTGENAWGICTCIHSYLPGQSSCHKGSSALSSSSCCPWEPWLEVGGMLECLRVEETFSIYFTGEESHCRFLTSPFY